MISGTDERRRLTGNPVVLLSIILSAGLALRIFLSLFLTYEPDFNVWRLWGSQVSDVGFGNFYDRFWCDYMPGYLYVLWALDNIHRLLPGIPVEILYKLPANLADLGISFLIFVWLKSITAVKTAIISSAVYFFNPASLSNSIFWGQVDSFHAFPILFSVLLALRQRYLLSGVFIALAFMIKPQSIVIFPVIGLLVLRPLLSLRPKLTPGSLLPVFGFIAAILLTIIIVALPFIWGRLDSVSYLFWGPIELIRDRFAAAYEQYKFTSLNAFNFWGAAAMWRNDEMVRFGLSFKTWGTVTFAAAYALIGGLLLFRTISGASTEYKNYAYAVSEALTLILFALFIVVTRAHERHLLPAIVFFTLIAFRSWIFWYLYAIVSCVYVINMVYSYIQLTTNYAGIDQYMGGNSYLVEPIIWGMFGLYLITFTAVLHDYIINTFNYKKSSDFPFLRA